MSIGPSASTLPSCSTVTWLAMLPMLVFFGLFVRRTFLEDRLLQQELEGYAEYARKVPYRLVVGLF